MKSYRDYNYELLFEESWEYWYFKVELMKDKWYIAEFSYEEESDAQLACEEVIASFEFSKQGSLLLGLPRD